VLDPALYAVFLVAATVLLAVPGPAVLNVVSQSIEGARRRPDGGSPAASWWVSG
jgi:threonine/homoserine/homoserine lactone efflux protein